MKNSHRAAAGAVAILAASIVGVSSAGSADATQVCKAGQLSASQLGASIAQAVAQEKQGSVAPLNVHPMGGWTPPPTIPPAS